MNACKQSLEIITWNEWATLILIKGVSTANAQQHESLRHVGSQLREELSSIIHIYSFLWRFSGRLKGWKCAWISGVLSSWGNRDSLTSYLCVFLRLRGHRLGDALHIPLDLREDLIQALHLLASHRIDLRRHKSHASCRDDRLANLSKKLTCFSVVVTGFALFLCFGCLVATWKTVLVFFPFCLFFPISPENTGAQKSQCTHTIMQQCPHLSP